MSDQSKGSALSKLEEALDQIEETSGGPTKGKWLEALTADCAPLLADWDCRTAWLWNDWPDRTGRDIGIDVVAERHDGALVAIQCKSRQLHDGDGKPITKGEVDAFVAAASGLNSPFAERWLVVNGAVDVNGNALPVMESHQIRHVNLRADIQRQYDALARPSSSEEESPDPQVESRDAMQDEAVRKACDRLTDNAEATGSSRDRIILPCGTGKSRIALRIIEQLTEPGQVSAILCPSIALVAQLRGEFLMHSQQGIAALAVCSDQTAARGTDLSKDQTADLSQTSARDVKGTVTTDATEISDWIRAVPRDRMGVIFGTYQSAFKVAEALQQGGHELTCMTADEAHRTAGIKRVVSQAQQLRNFTVCHDQSRFPAKYRVYQTATPKVYQTAQQRRADDRLTREGKWIVRSMDDENVFGPELYRRSYADAVANGWLSDYRIIALGVNDQKAYDTANAIADREGSALSTVQVIRGLALALVRPAPPPNRPAPSSHQSTS